MKWPFATCNKAMAIMFFMCFLAIYPHHPREKGLTFHMAEPLFFPGKTRCQIRVSMDLDLFFFPHPVIPIQNIHREKLHLYLVTYPQKPCTPSIFHPHHKHLNSLATSLRATPLNPLTLPPLLPHKSNRASPLPLPPMPTLFPHQALIHPLLHSAVTSICGVVV